MTNQTRDSIRTALSVVRYIRRGEIESSSMLVGTLDLVELHYLISALAALVSRCLDDIEHSSLSITGDRIIEMMLENVNGE
jgi:hypothetical protein